MPRPRFERLPEGRREPILEAAARAFAAHGYEGASLNRILEQAGVSKGAAYYYFDDKADLFLAVVVRYAQELAPLESIDPAALTAETFWPAVAAFYRRPVLASLDRPWAFGAMKAGGKLAEDAQGHPALVAYADRVLAFLRALLRRGQAVGVVRTDLPEDLLLALVRAVDDASDRWFLTHWEGLERATAERVLDGVVDALRRLLTPAPRGGHGGEAQP